MTGSTEPPAPSEPRHGDTEVIPADDQPARRNGLNRVLAVLGIVVLIAAGIGAVKVLQPKPLPPLHLTKAGHPASVATGPLPELKAGSYTGIKPATIGFSADGGDWIADINWQSWTATKAVGTGTRTLQSCKPNCAQGTQTQVPEILVLSNPQDGFFTTIVATFAGQIQEYNSGAGLWALGAQQTDNG
jgi:hypothetical protein